MKTPSRMRPWGPILQRRRGTAANRSPTTPRPRETTWGALGPGRSAHPRGSSVASRGSTFSLQVARQLQPSVVWIGDTEKTFYKKVPSAERTVRAPLPPLGAAFSLLVGAGGREGGQPPLSTLSACLYSKGSSGLPLWDIIQKMKECGSGGGSSKPKHVIRENSAENSKGRARRYY